MGTNVIRLECLFHIDNIFSFSFQSQGESNYTKVKSIVDLRSGTDTLTNMMCLAKAICYVAVRREIKWSRDAVFTTTVKRINKQYINFKISNAPIRMYSE